MRIGILSDSHGKHERTEAAAKLLATRGAELLVHLGDLGSDAVIGSLVLALDKGRPSPPVRIVFGNCDTRFPEMARFAEDLGITVDDWAGRVEAGGKTVAFTHGHMVDLMHRAVADGTEYLLHGHTHEVRDERIDRTRIINPGALQRASRYTVALLDTSTDLLETIEIKP